MDDYIMLLLSLAIVAFTTSDLHADKPVLNWVIRALLWLAGVVAFGVSLYKVL